MYIGTAKLVTPPTVEPVTLEEAKLHCRVDGTEEDAFITGLIVAARQTCEQWCGRAFLAQTWDLYLRAFPASCVYLPHPPVASVTEITYLDAAGDQQTLDPAAYVLDDVSDPGRVVPAYGETWPATRDFLNSVRIRYVAGVASADEVDGRVKQAIRMIVAHWYQNRETVLSGTISKEIELAARMLMGQLWSGVVG